MSSRFLTGLAAAGLTFLLQYGSAGAATGDPDKAAKPPEPQDWSFNGPLGTFDRAALQRGYQVYREVCSSCHGMKYLAFRNLSQPGGPEFSEEEVKALAAEFTIEDGPDDFGDMIERPGKPSDYFPNPFRNDQEAKASNGGALPPDLSVITKARPDGANYVFALLTHYDNPPADFDLTPGLEYNPYFKDRQIAMAQPLFADIVEYSDGTEASIRQMASDVTTFLAWASEPEMEARKGMAVPALLYLGLLTVLLYISYKKIWRDVSKD